MAWLSDTFIAQVKSSNDIVEMFRTYTDVKKRGRIYTCCCPFHSEKTPSCTIYPESDSFYCFGCHTGGDVIKFVMLMDNVSYVEAIQILAKRSGIPMPVVSFEENGYSNFREKCYEINRETANFYYQNLLTGSDKSGLQYLKFHGIKPETVKKYALGYAPDSAQSLYTYLKNKGYSNKELYFSGLFISGQNEALTDYFQNCILFPEVDFRGNVIAFNGMSLKTSAFSHTSHTAVSNEKEFIFSLNFAKKESDANFLILAENYFNAILLHQAGFSNVTAVPNMLTSSHVKKLSQYTREMILIQSPCSHFGDLQKIQNLFSEAEMQIKILNFQETSGSGEFLKNYGAEAFRKKFIHAGDAVQNALQEAWHGLDAEQDKALLIQQTVNILSKIKDPLEREIYVSSASEKLHLPPEQLWEQLNKISSHQSAKPQQCASRSLTQEELMGLPRKQESS